MMHLAVDDALSMYKSYGRKGSDRIILVMTDGLPTGGRSGRSRYCPECADRAFKEARAKGVKVVFVLLDTQGVFKSKSIPQSWMDAPPIKLNSFKNLKVLCTCLRTSSCTCVYT